MKTRTQFILTLSFFGLLLIGMAVSLLLTNQQVDRLRQQEEIAHRIEQGAIELSHLSGDYLMYGESQQRARWESSFASFSEDVSRLNPANPAQQTIADHIRTDQARLQAVFTDVVSALEESAQTSGGVPDPVFSQVSWSRMEVLHAGQVSAKITKLARAGFVCFALRVLRPHRSAAPSRLRVPAAARHNSF